MANRKKSYFLTPGWDIPASAVQLGSILTEPTEPHKPLNLSPPSRPTSTPSSAIVTAFTIDTPIHPTFLKNYTTTLSASKNNKLGLFATFLQAFGLGTETSVDFTFDDISTCTFKSLTTEWFIPSPSFIASAVALDSVQGFLKMARPKTPLYIITGLRVGEGISALSSKSKGRNLKAKVGVDGTPVGIPVGGGPEVEHGRKKGEEVEWEAEGPLVFAYQLCQVRFVKGEWRKNDFVKGALFGLGGEGPKGVEVDVEGAEEGFEGELEEVEIKEGWDELDGEECVVVVPEIEE